MNVSWRVTEQHNALMPPTYLSDVSAWHGHIPFAFWLAQVLKPECFVELGVHAGDSYMAWCQGLQEVGEPCNAIGIDTFEGDEHAGDYGAGMYQKVLAVHNPLYGEFSTVVEDSFENYSNKMPDGQIDLLHIDGCHTYEACDRDFRMWLPKMSRRGVMVLHDTQVTNVMGFGVFRKWDELNLLYPSFDFFHSSGLGILLVGPEYNELLSDMCAVNGKSEGQWIREYFEVLASRVHAQRNARQGNGLPN
jgi:hypothetical protein